MRHIEDFVDVPKHLELGKHAFLALEDYRVFFEKKNPNNKKLKQTQLKKTSKKQPQQFTLILP